MLPENIIAAAKYWENEEWANEGPATPLVNAKRGEAIFAGRDSRHYPRDFVGFVGQAEAKAMLDDAITDAQHRGDRLDHTLIASGVHGVGKSTLAHLIAYRANVGLLTTSGALTQAEFRTLACTMADNDILFWDEFHMAVAGNKNRVDWLLNWLLDGVLLGPNGVEKIPNITLVAATTEAGKLPDTVTSRFFNQLPIVGYTDDEAAEIAFRMSLRMDVFIADDLAEPIATAAGKNPRAMQRILTQYRILAHRGPVDMDTVFARAGVAADGLSSLACEILVLLLHSPDQTLSIAAIGRKLGEPGPLRYHEQVLEQRGLVEVTGQGRKLTDQGRARARAIVVPGTR
jgi:Holliday junction DNA helicase RuvB